MVDIDEEYEEEGDAPTDKLDVIELVLDLVAEGVLDLEDVAVRVAVSVVDGEAPIEREGVGEGVGVTEGVADDVGVIVVEGEGEHVALGDAPTLSEGVGDGVFVIVGVIEDDVVIVGVTEGVGVPEEVIEGDETELVVGVVDRV